MRIYCQWCGHADVPEDAHVPEAATKVWVRRLVTVGAETSPMPANLDSSVHIGRLPRNLVEGSWSTCRDQGHRIVARRIRRIAQLDQTMIQTTRTCRKGESPVIARSARRTGGSLQYRFDNCETHLVLNPSSNEHPEEEGHHIP